MSSGTPATDCLTTPDTSGSDEAAFVVPRRSEQRGASGNRRRKSDTSVDFTRDVESAQKRLAVAKTLSKYFIEPPYPGFLGIFETVHALLLKLTALPTKVAYRSFKLYSQLQRVTRIPHPPHNIHDFKCLSPWKKEDRLLDAQLNKFVKVATATYGAVNLMEYGVNLSDDEIKPTDSHDLLFHQIMPGCRVVASRTELLVCKPIWFLIDDPDALELIVAIQGSTEMDDWKTNLMCDYHELGTHRGMQWAADNLDEEIGKTALEFAQSHKNKYQIVLTGHSLGAGTATLLGTKWIENFPHDIKKKIRVFAFASPCVLPKAVAGKHSHQIYSIVFSKDLVCRLSFESFRDLVVILHALGKYLKACEGRDPLTEEEIREAIRQEEEESERETAKLTTRREGSEIGQPVGADQIKLQIPQLSAKRNSEEAAEMTRRIAAAEVTLPLTFNQLSTILKKRVEEMDKTRAALSKNPGKKVTFGFWTKLAWRLVKCYHGGCCKSTHEPLDIDRETEDRLLKSSMYSIMKLAGTLKDDDLIPGGRCLLIVPRLHFLEAGVKPPCEYNKGQCIVYKLEKKNVYEMTERPIWSTSAISEHRVNHYIQGLAADCLKRVPLESSLSVEYVAGK